MTAMDVLVERIVAAKVKRLLGSKPVFRRYKLATTPELAAVERSLGCTLPGSLKDWPLNAGYGDFNEELSLREAWFSVIDRGELQGHVQFGQDDCSRGSKAWPRGRMRGVLEPAVRRYPLCMKLTELIFEKRGQSCQPEWLANLFGRLIWLTEDNGAEIMGSLKRWLESDNQEKVQIALAFDEAFLWEDAAEMDRLLAGVLSRFPAEAHQCEVARSQWSKHFPNGGPVL